MSYQKYNWKKAAATAASIFLGELLAHFHSESPLVWSYWHGVIVHAAELSIFAEARYVYVWLAQFNGGGTDETH